MAHGTSLIFRAKTNHRVTASYRGPESVVIPHVQESEPLLAGRGAPDADDCCEEKQGTGWCLGDLLLPNVTRKRHLKSILTEDNFV